MTRISSTSQITPPVAALRGAGLRAGEHSAHGNRHARAGVGMAPVGLDLVLDGLS